MAFPPAITWVTSSSGAALTVATAGHPSRGTPRKHSPWASRTTSEVREDEEKGAARRPFLCQPRRYGLKIEIPPSMKLFCAQFGQPEGAVADEYGTKTSPVTGSTATECAL